MCSPGSLHIRLTRSKSYSHITGSPSPRLPKPDITPNSLQGSNRDRKAVHQTLTRCRRGTPPARVAGAKLPDYWLLSGESETSAALDAQEPSEDSRGHTLHV